MNVIEANGARIPAIGLGTMTLKEAGVRRRGEDRVAPRLSPYRHRRAYGNESEVGEGLQQGLARAASAREDVFVTTKVYHDRLAAARFRALGRGKPARS